MKKLIFAGLFLLSLNAHAGIVIFGFGGGHQKIVDLPKVEAYQIDGKHVDIGATYDDFNLFFMPVWQWNKQFCLVIEGNSKSYYPITGEKLAALAKEANVELPSKIKLDFWNEWGGKLVILSGILAMFLFGQSKKNAANKQGETA